MKPDKKALLFLAFLLTLTGHCQPNGSYVSIADSKLFYQKSGTGPAIIFLHGGLLDSRMWKAQTEAFSKKHTVITCDLRGHGQTLDGDSAYFMHDALRTLLDSLHIKNANVVGLSLGAMAALDFTVVYPRYVSKLIMVSPGLNGSKTDQPEDSILNRNTKLMMQNLRTRKDTIAAEYFIRSWFDGPYRQPEMVNQFQRNFAKQMAIDFYKDHRFRNWIKLSPPQSDEKLASIKTQTLIVVAEKDQPVIFRNAEYLKSKIPHSAIVKIKNGAHTINLEEPNRLNSIIKRFLK